MAVAPAGANADRVGMASRTIGAALFGAVVGAWVGRALFKWILDVDGIVPIVAVALAGAIVCAVAERGSA